MNGYFLSLGGVAFAVAVVSYVSYQGGCEGAVRSALSVLLLAAVALPLLHGMPAIFPDGAAPAFSPPEEYRVASVCESAFCEGIRREITTSFSLEEETVAVSVSDFDVQTMRAGKIYVVLSGSSVIADTRLIARRIGASGLGDCEVSIAIG